MRTKVRTTAIATLTAVSLALSFAAPAQALGKNERNLLKGVAAAVIIGTLLNEATKSDPQPQYAPPPPQPPVQAHRPHQERPQAQWQQDQWQQNPRRQDEWRQDDRQDWRADRGNDWYDDQPAQTYARPYETPHLQSPPRIQPNSGRLIGSNTGAIRTSAPSVYSTIAAQSFNSYTTAERRAIQRQLSNFGYYTGSIDGAFGPGTYSAVQAYARDAGGSRQLDSQAGSFGLYDRLIN